MELLECIEERLEEPSISSTGAADAMDEKSYSKPSYPIIH